MLGFHQHFETVSQLFKDSREIRHESAPLLFVFHSRLKMAQKRSSNDADLSPKIAPSKRFRYQEFHDEYCEAFDLISEGKKGSSFAFCEICACDISIRTGGKK